MEKPPYLYDTPLVYHNLHEMPLVYYNLHET